MAETCQDHHTHDQEMPAGYIARQNWFKRMAKTHKQEQCPVCGLWLVWVDTTFYPVPTHHGYSVNRLGQIMGPSGKLLQPMSNLTGHLFVITPPPRRPRKLFVHRAVLFAFIGPPGPGQEVRHLNGIPSDNRLANLKWGNRMEQCEDKRRHGTLLRGEKSSGSKLSQTEVLEIRSKAKQITLRCLARQYGVSHTAIRRVIIGRTWSSVGTESSHG